MFRATIYCQIAKWKLNRGVKLLERDGRLRSFKFVKKRNIETADGDVVMGAGKYLRQSRGGAIRRSQQDGAPRCVDLVSVAPQPRSRQPPSLPCPNALKNLHGAV